MKRILALILLSLNVPAFAYQTQLLPPTTTVKTGTSVTVFKAGLGVAPICYVTGTIGTAISSTIALQASSNNINFMTLATISVSGTGNGIGNLCTAATDGSDPCSAGIGSNVAWGYWRAVVTAISANTSVTCDMGY